VREREGGREGGREGESEGEREPCFEANVAWALWVTVQLLDLDSVLGEAEQLMKMLVSGNM